MDFNTYQKLAEMTAVYPDKGGIKGLAYTALGLTGESGEVANKVKKLLRDGMTLDKIPAIVDELSDVLWYISAVASELNVNFDDIAVRNIEKLKARQQAGTLTGNGDNR